jgi:type I restriction enzyme, S subunit
MSQVRLPTGWVWRKIGDICTTTSGGTPSRRRADYFQGAIPWIKSGELPDGLITLDGVEEYITEEAIRDSSAKVFSKGTLLIALYGATVGKLGILGMTAATNQAVCAIFQPDYIERDFLFWYLKAIRNQLLEISFGGAQPNISQTVIKNTLFPIPFPDEPERSLMEQRRIVARIEALLAEVREMRALHEEITADGNRLMGACIQEVFGQQNGGWQTDQLSEVAFIQTGAAKGGRYGDKQLIDVPYLRVANVQAGFLDLAEIKTISIPEEKIDRYRLEVGDLLLTEGGDYDKLGRGAIWEGQIENCIHQNHVFAVRFDQQRVLPKFAEYEMQSRYAKDYFLRVAKKTTNLASINKTQLGNFPIRYPAELAEQERIINHLDVVLAEVVEMQKSQIEDGGFLDKLEQSILNQAFRGEL